MSDETRDLAEKSLIEIAQGTAAAFGAKAKVDYTRGYPRIVNRETQTEFAAEIVERGCQPTKRAASQIDHRP